MTWGFLTGFISTKLLMPPAAQKRSASVGTTVVSLFEDPPRETTTPISLLHSGPDAQIEAAFGDDLRPVALVTSQSRCGGADPIGSSDCGAGAEGPVSEKRSAAAPPSTVPPVSVLFLYRAGSVAGQVAAQRLAGETLRAGVE